jgi:methylphosphotriester-DNA--protein-cysteine methyltransferase
MNPKTLRDHGSHVLNFARAVPNMGRLGELTRAAVEMLRSKDWRDYRDATGAYHFYPGEFDYFLALQTVDARDVARFYVTSDERVELAGAMDRTRTGEARYRRSLEEVTTAHPHAAQSLTTYWNRYGWSDGKPPVSMRAIIQARTGVTPEEHARQARIKRLRQLRDDWKDRVARVVKAAEGLTRDELLAAIEQLKERAAAAKKSVNEQWRVDAEELEWSAKECAKRWGTSPEATRVRFLRLGGRPR